MFSLFFLHPVLISQVLQVAYFKFVSTIAYKSMFYSNYPLAEFCLGT